MTGKCGIARDLMPLCADGAASGESEEYVAGHIAQCEACRSYYDQMRAALPEKGRRDEENEQRLFAAVASKKRSARVKRRLAAACLCLIAVVALTAGGIAVYNQAVTQLPSSQIRLSMVRLERGLVLISAANTGDKPTTGNETRLDKTDGGYILRINMESYRFGRGGLNTPNSLDEMFLEYPFEEDDVVKVTAGRDNAVVWEQGQEITPASPEMEETFAALDAFEAFQRTLEAKYDPDGKGYIPEGALTAQEEREWLELAQAVRDKERLVPEWIISGFRLTLPEMP